MTTNPKPGDEAEATYGEDSARRIVQALAAPDDDPDRILLLDLLEHRLASLAAETFGEAHLRSAPQKLAVRVIRRLVRDQTRDYAATLGLDEHGREQMSRLATLGFWRFKVSLRKATADGADRATASARMVAMLSPEAG